MITIDEIMTVLGYVIMMAMGIASALYLVYGSLNPKITLLNFLLLPFAVLAAFVAAFVFILLLAGITDFITAVYNWVIRQ